MAAMPNMVRPEPAMGQWLGPSRHAAAAGQAAKTSRNRAPSGALPQIKRRSPKDDPDGRASSPTGPSAERVVCMGPDQCAPNATASIAARTVKGRAVRDQISAFPRQDSADRKHEWQGQP